MARHMAVSEGNNYATMPVSYKAHKHEGSSNDSSEHLQQSEKLINDTYYPTITQCTGPIPIYRVSQDTLLWINNECNLDLNGVMLLSSRQPHSPPIVLFTPL